MRQNPSPGLESRGGSEITGVVHYMAAMIGRPWSVRPIIESLQDLPRATLSTTDEGDTFYRFGKTSPVGYRPIDKQDNPHGDPDLDELKNECQEVE